MNVKLATPKNISDLWGTTETLTQRDLARILKVSMQTIFNYRKRFGLPCHTVGNIVRFNPDEVREWWEAKTQERFKEESND